MTVEKLDALVDAQFSYERARLRFFGFDCEPAKIYQFIKQDQMRLVETTVRKFSSVEGKNAFALRTLEYRGCVFQCPVEKED